MPRSGNIKKEDKATSDQYPYSGENQEGGQDQQRDPQFFSEIGRKGGKKTQEEGTVRELTDEERRMGGQISGGSTMPDEEE